MNTSLINTARLAAPTRNLALLCSIRGIVLAGQSAFIAYVFWALHVSMTYRPVMAMIGAAGVLTLLTLYRLRKPWPVTEPEFFGHLLIDIVSLSVLLYFTGGANNPFVSYFLVPVCISAATLPWRYTWIITGLSLTAYSVMLFHYVPFELLSPVHHRNPSGILNPHLLGMWANFIVSALLITYFVVRMARAIRDQEQQLQLTREEISNNEHILGLATLAAGTVHELATPLSTMSVTLSDLARERGNDDTLAAEITLLRQQLEVCKKTLRKLAQTAELPLGSSRVAKRVDIYLAELIDEWKIIRPDAGHTLNINPAAPAPDILTDPTLTQAIQNLLNNAADASRENINVSLDWNDTHVTLTIEDNGPGLPLALAGKLGKPFVTTKHQGLGLGLFLSHATAGRFNGRLEIYNRKGTGTCTTLTLPLTI